jgi:hypothetical protein
MPERSRAADQEWSLKDLIPVAPLVAGAFAFAFVVGYFLAFDISWFAFFTLSEHVVFALRALPIAIGLSFAFLIALALSKTPRRARLKHFLSYVWIVVLVVIGVLTFRTYHTGMAFTLWLIAIGIFVYDRKPGIRTPFVTFLFSATNMMIVSVAVGWVSGAVWWLGKMCSFLPLSDSRAVIIRLNPKPADGNAGDQDKKVNAHKKGDDEEYVRGHVIFAGGESVLFYEFDHNLTRLFRWDSIKEIIECGMEQRTEYNLEDCRNQAQQSMKGKDAAGGK